MNNSQGFCFVQVWNSLADALPAAQRVCYWGKCVTPGWATEHVPLSLSSVLLVLCVIMDPVFALRSSFLSTHPRRRRKGTPFCLPSMWGVSWLSKFTFRMNKYSIWFQVGISSAPVGPSWSAVTSAHSLERWGYPSQTTRLKTASWPWRRASWGCPSTPACWSMPSWSGGWGESLNLPLTRHTLQTPEVSICSQVATPPTPRSSSGDVHRWEDSWG